MAKQYKIKRYKNISRMDSYGRTRRRKIILGVIAAFLLFVLGWMLYQPVYDFLTGRLAQELGSQSSSQPDISQAPPSSQPEQSQPQPEPEPEPGFKALFIPNAVLSNGQALDALISSMKEAGLDAALIELKDTSGMLSYSSALPEAASIRAVPPAPIDMPSVVARLKAAGVKPLARIHAFRDPIAGARIEDAGVKYQQTDMLWLDNSKENGGKAWLNPYSDKARAYISSVALEAADMGFTHIIMDSFHFPLGFGLHLAGYGEQAATTTRHGVLSNYADELRGRLETKGVGMSVYAPVTTALGINEDRFGGSPVSMSGGSAAVGVMPNLLGARFEAQGLMLTAPVQSPYETVKALLSRLKQDAPNTEIIPFLQAYTDRTIAYEANKSYTWQDVLEQVRAAQELGMESYVVYDPAGEYKFE